MTKEQYLFGLREALSSVNISNIDSRIEFYEEMIDDRIEDGMSEEDAVASMESIASVVENSRYDKPVAALVKEKVQNSREKAEKKGHGALWVILITLGFPLWFPILLTVGILAFVVVLLFGILLFVVNVVEFAFGIAAIACIIAPFKLIGSAATFGTKIGSLGAGLILVGVCILMWKPLTSLCKGAVKSFSKGIKALKKKIF